jgi:very-short-patch-repair endonuclease
VCNKAFQVLAVIELDDASHKGRQDKDAARSALLEGAGYRVIRYANVPDIDKVRADFMSGAALDQKTKPEGRTPQEPSL